MGYYTKTLHIDGRYEYEADDPDSLGGIQWVDKDTNPRVDWISIIKV